MVAVSTSCMADVSTTQNPPPVRFIRSTRALVVQPQFQSRNCSMHRSKSMGSFDHDECSGVQTCAGNTVATLGTSTSYFVTNTEPRRASQSLGGGLCRSASMSQFQKSRPAYNRAVGETLAKSPKKRPVNTNEDIAIMVELLIEL